MGQTPQSAGRKNTSKPYKIGLSLQGGGSYGAFMHGALRALLEEDIRFDSVTGTSAGSVNAALLSYGMNTGGSQSAMTLFESFWNSVKCDGVRAKTWMMFVNPFALGGGDYPNLGRIFTLAAKMPPPGMVSGHLKDKLNSFIRDWDKVGTGDMDVHVNATRVDPDTGDHSHAIFSNADVNADTVMASCSLKDLGPTVIDGAAHYDGAYRQNPSLENLEADDTLTDILFINIQRRPAEAHKPVHQDDARAQIADEFHVMGSEIYDHIEHVRQARPDLNLHVIGMDVHPDWDETSRMNTDPRWLNELEQMGYDAGREWINTHRHALGKTTSYAPPSSARDTSSSAATPRQSGPTTPPAP